MFTVKTGLPDTAEPIISLKIESTILTLAKPDAYITSGTEIEVKEQFMTSNLPPLTTIRTSEYALSTTVNLMFLMHRLPHDLTSNILYEFALCRTTLSPKPTTVKFFSMLKPQFAIFLCNPGSIQIVFPLPALENA